MTREWAPGDVVSAKWPYIDADRYVMVSSDACSRSHRHADHWHSLGGANWAVSIEGGNPRPLVVIDPENREQVEQLTKAFFDASPKVITGIAFDDRSAIDRLWRESMLRALREFANPTPPKPDEPMGLGAVVEDAEGMKWLRHDSVPIRCCWLNTDDCETRYRAWDEINAVRILSEGFSDD